MILYLQWFAGKVNGTSDVLSQDSPASYTLFHPQPGNTKLLHLSAAGRHILLADLTSLVTASHQGVKEGTH
jgi:hypothetical protein